MWTMCQITALNCYIFQMRSFYIGDVGECPCVQEMDIDVFGRKVSSAAKLMVQQKKGGEKMEGGRETEYRYVNVSCISNWLVCLTFFKIKNCSKIK